MKTVSVKQLRQELPQVLKNLGKGEEYLLIYHSKPVGELIPLRKRKGAKKTKDLYELLEQSYGEITLPEGQGAADLIRADRDS